MFYNWRYLVYGLYYTVWKMLQIKTALFIVIKLSAPLRNAQGVCSQIIFLVSGTFVAVQQQTKCVRCIVKLNIPCCVFNGTIQYQNIETMGNNVNIPT